MHTLSVSMFLYLFMSLSLSSPYILIFSSSSPSPSPSPSPSLSLSHLFLSFWCFAHLIVAVSTTFSLTRHRLALPQNPYHVLIRASRKQRLPGSEPACRASTSRNSLILTSLHPPSDSFSRPCLLASSLFSSSSPLSSSSLPRPLHPS
jgi:hypothetical protein